MERLEIILLRTSGDYKKDARKYMGKFCRIVRKYNLSEAHFYVRASIPGNLALVIQSQTGESKFVGTDLGVYVADLLKQFWIVDYNCWLMEDDK